MKCQWAVAATVAGWVLHMPFGAGAFECPTHFADAQASIDKASESVKHVQDGGMPLAALSHLRHARMSLIEAKYHHAQSGEFHHARSIVRANEARGHALVAHIMSGNSKDE
jgi:hypothetical protein